MKRSIACCVVLVLAATASAAPDKGKVPITTASEEARQLYLKGRDLTERLRATDAHALFQQAIEKDAGFAMAHLNVGLTAGSTKGFFDALGRAVALADKASPGEALLIKSVEAGAKNDAARQKEYLDKLVRAFPTDERALQLLGNFQFARQEYAAAIATFEKVSRINPAF